MEEGFSQTNAESSLQTIVQTSTQKSNDISSRKSSDSDDNLKKVFSKSSKGCFQDEIQLIDEMRERKCFQIIQVQSKRQIQRLRFQKEKNIFDLIRI
jgi:hypothetical protein